MSLNTGFQTALIICIIIGLLFFIAGYFIWKKQKLQFIAGYNEDEFQGDKKRLARDMGLFSIAIGVLVILAPFIVQYLGDWAGLVLIGIFFVLTIGIVIKINLHS